MTDLYWLPTSAQHYTVKAQFHIIPPPLCTVIGCHGNLCFSFEQILCGCQNMRTLLNIFIHIYTSLTSGSAVAFSMTTALQSVRSSYISPDELLHLRFGNWAKLKNISTVITHDKYLQKYIFLSSYYKIGCFYKMRGNIFPLKRSYSYVFLLNN